MANVWFIADLHFGHNNITRFRPFESEEAHREHIKDNWKRVVKERDTVWVLGDSVFNEENLKDIAELPGTKNLVMGNHCGQGFNGLFTKLFPEYFNKVFGITKKYGAWLTHCPIHPDELRGKFNIHGHTHNHLIDDLRYINVCVEQTNYTPISLLEIRAIMEKRNDPV